MTIRSFRLRAMKSYWGTNRVDRVDNTRLCWLAVSSMRAETACRLVKERVDAFTKTSLVLLSVMHWKLSLIADSDDWMLWPCIKGNATDDLFLAWKVSKGVSLLSDHCAASALGTASDDDCMCKTFVQTSYQPEWRRLKKCMCKSLIRRQMIVKIVLRLEWWRFGWCMCHYSSSGKTGAKFK